MKLRKSTSKQLFNFSKAAIIFIAVIFLAPAGVSKQLNFSASRKQQLLCAPVCWYLLGIECLFLKMDEDESPIARSRLMNNEHQARYRTRQPSEARRQANAESQRIRRQQDTTEQSEARRQSSVEHLFIKPSRFDGFQLVYL